MLSTIQDYQNQIYNTENDSLLEYMKAIAEAVLKYYPDHVESLSDLSIVYSLKGQYNLAIESLEKAMKVNPKDYIVLNNLAYAYKMKGDRENAIKYYEMTIKYGDKDAKDYAKKQIDDLKKSR